MSEAIHVAVAVIVNDNNKVCISLRHENLHQGGLWEFPGGKLEPNETVEQALAREIKEEIDLEVQQSRNLITIWHDYPDRCVCLHVRKVSSYQGVASSAEGQAVKWVDITELNEYDFPAANLPIIKALQLPYRYLITGKFTDLNDFTVKLKAAVNNGIELVQLRLKKDTLKDVNHTQLLVESSAMICRQAGARLMLNLSPENLKVVDLSAVDFAGFHADSTTLNAMCSSKKAENKLFSASCHTTVELNKAVQLNADFVVLSPVQKTASHPDLEAMGWQKFSEMIERVTIPVYALGGVSGKDMAMSWSHGGQGIAAISAFWNS
jgi:8-oxo-dGTP diphosphatase